MKATEKKVFYAFDVNDTCWYGVRDSIELWVGVVDEGTSPQLAVTEGNVYYSWLKDGVIKRAWGYKEGSWKGLDSLILSDSVGIFTSAEGVVYSFTCKDTQLVKEYIYEPFSKEFFFSSEREGTFPHPFLFTKDRLYKLSFYTANKDTLWYPNTAREGYPGIVCSYYLEAREEPTPYTLYRDGFIDYGHTIIEYGNDSLVYYFDRFVTGREYALVIEFYFEGSSGTDLLICMNSMIDSLSISPGVFSWYTASLGNISTFKLKIEKLTGEIVGVSRILVVRKDPGGFLLPELGIKNLRKLVSTFCLYQNYPNPLRDKTLIQYAIPIATMVSLKIYDLSGRLVKTLVNKKQFPGIYKLYWEGKDEVGRECASGVYFLRMETEGYKATKKMVLIR